MHTFWTFLIIVFLSSTLSSQQDIESVKDNFSVGLINCTSSSISFKYENPFIDYEEKNGFLPVTNFLGECVLGDFTKNGTKYVVNDKITYYFYNDVFNNFTGIKTIQEVSGQYNLMYTYYHANEFLKTIPEIVDSFSFPVQFKEGSVGASYDGTNILYQAGSDWQKDISGVISGVTAYLFKGFDLLSSSGLSLGTRDFMAQLYKWENTIDKTHKIFTSPKLPKRSTNSELCYNPSMTAYAEDNGPVWATLLMRIHTDVINDYDVSMDLAFKSMKKFIKTDGQVQAAEKLYSLIKEPDFGLNQTQICAIRTIITDHYKCLNPSTLRPKLDDIADYYIADDTSDNGTEPNPSNTSEWESPAIINRQNNDGLFENQAAVANVENTLYIEIANKGCDTLTDAVLQVYYALSQTGLTWDDAWVENVITVGSSTIMAGDKIAEIAIPSITSQFIRIPITWTPPDIESLNVPNTKINILARIVSADDVMSEVEVKDVRTNVRNNNNVGWKVLNLVK
jgi:hypothetical protein